MQTSLFENDERRSGFLKVIAVTKTIIRIDDRPVTPDEFYAEFQRVIAEHDYHENLKCLTKRTSSSSPTATS